MEKTSWVLESQSQQGQQQLLQLWVVSGLVTFASLCQREASPFLFLAVPYCKRRKVPVGL